MNLRATLWRRVPVLWQSEAQECGVICVAMVGAYHGRDLDLPDLRARGLAGSRGSTLNDLIALAEAEGLSSRGLRLEPADLKRLALPAVLHWDLKHFVVLVRVGRRGIWIHDPARGRRHIAWAEVSRHFTGVALELRPSDRFRERPLARRLKLSDLWRGAVGLGGTLANVLALSLLLQLTSILGPLQVQWAIDQGVMRADRELIVLLALGFAVLLLVRLAAQLLRGWLITRLTYLLAFEFGRNLFGHMLRLPLDWFEKRHLGDITSRFGSLGPVRDAITQGLVAVCVDGFMALAMLAMMVAYDALLAGLVVAACAVYLVVRFAQVPALARIAMDEINHQARAESSFLESIRAMPAVRVYGQERARLDLWQNHQAGAINAGIQGAKWGLAGDGAQTLIFGIETILIVYLGANHVLDGGLTIGMLYAFLSYKGEFTGRLAELVRQGLELRLLRVHLERLADPYCAPAELSRDPVPEQPLRGALRLAEVGFRYGERDAWVIRDVDLVVRPGECVALVGPSGGGKSTLIKLLMGQARPIMGTVSVAERPLEGVWLRRYRQSIGCVLQDDALFAGSLAANISLFDSQFDLERLERACRQAGIDTLAATLPMGLETPVGDMGAAFSGGQVQRLLLARALYRSPEFLFLDEGTAHLDPETRREVQSMIVSLPCTRIFATHDLSFAERADRVYEVRDGRVGEWENFNATRFRDSPIPERSSTTRGALPPRQAGQRPQSRKRGETPGA